jgi:hypothetical protein
MKLTTRTLSASSVAFSVALRCSTDSHSTMFAGVSAVRSHQPGLSLRSRPASTSHTFSHLARSAAMMADADVRADSPCLRDKQRASARLKARLLVVGCQQTPGVTYDTESRFAPTAQMHSDIVFLAYWLSDAACTGSAGAARCLGWSSSEGEIRGR